MTAMSAVLSELLNVALLKERQRSLNHQVFLKGPSLSKCCLWALSKMDMHKDIK